jgi:sulfite dehydrogenase
MNPRNSRRLLWSAPLLALLTLPALAAPLKITLPPEPLTLKEIPGAELAKSQCLICHSSEYMSSQPALPRAYWKGAVGKMQAKFGAAIAPEQVDPLVDYLVKAFGKAD